MTPRPSTTVGRADTKLGLETLLAAIEERAAWRKQRADQQTDDARNASSARALRRLASFIRQNPDDPAVRAVLSVQQANEHVSLSRLSEGSLQELTAYGFAPDSHVHPTQFLVRLAFILENDVDLSRG